MRMHHWSIGLATGLFVLAAGCDASEQPAGPETSAQQIDAMTPAGDSPTAEATLGAQLAALRRATARFHRREAAAAAGYEILVTHPTSGAACLDHPTEGGMGRHYLKESLVDPEVAVESPEVLIYEPMANGKLRLVGVEYIIPYEIRGPNETPPTLFGREFLHNPTFKLWMLHVWVWKNNPEGMFATWNPRITCEHDAAVD